MICLDFSSQFDTQWNEIYIYKAIELYKNNVHSARNN